MNAAPLALEVYFITRFAFAVQPRYSPPDADWKLIAPEHLSVDVKVQQNLKESLKYRVMLLLTFEKAAVQHYPYQFDLEIMGYFHVLPEFPEEEREQLVRVNAPSLLYSVAREFLAATTSRGPFPELRLPSITFNDAPIVPAAVKRPKAKRLRKARVSPRLAL